MKLYDIIIDDEDVKMTAISLVANPAVEKNFLAFKECKRKAMHCADEEKHNIIGVVALADTPIYRYSSKLGEYYVRFTEDAIRQLMEKYAKEGRYSLVDTEHNDTFEDGVYMVEMWQVDEEQGKGYPKELGFIPKGSLMVTFHIDNEVLWERIKSGELKGFSLSGVFDLEEVAEQFSRTNKLTQLIQAMKKKGSFLFKAAKALMRFSELATDKGLLVLEELGIGNEVMDADGNAVEDGEYVLEDGTILVVKDSAIEEIREAIVEEPKEEEVIVEAEEEQPIVEEEVVEEPLIDEEKESMKARIAELEKENEELRAQLAEKDAQMAEAVEEFAKQQPKEETQYFMGKKVK